MKKNNLKNVPLWKIAIRLGLIFILVLSLIRFFWNWIESGNLTFLKAGIESGKWVSYLISNVIGGLIYGFSMGYYFKNQKS